MRQVEPSQAGPKIARLRSVAALLLAGGLLATGLGCTTASPPQGTTSEPSSSVSTQTSVARVRARIQALDAQRANLAAQPDALQAELKAKRERHNASEAQLAEMTARLDQLNAKLQAATERYNSMQESLEATGKP